MRFVYSLLLLFIGSIVTYAQQTNKVWSLEECVDYAIHNNISVKKSELATQLKEADVTSAKMNFYPSVSGSVGANYSFGAPLSDSSLYNSYGISSGVTLYNGQRNKHYVTLAERDLEISNLNIQKSKDDISLFVVNAYLDILYNRENVKIAREQISIGENLVERMQGLVDAGTKARNDLFQVEANLASNEEAVVTAENNLDLALLNLAQTLQISHVGFDVADVSINLESAKLLYNNSELIYEKALTTRPEIESAKMSIENADLDIVVAKAGKLPTVSASYSFDSDYYFNVEDDAFNQSGYFKQIADNRGHSLGVSVGIPIFDKNATKIGVQRAQILKEMAEFTLEDEKTNLRATVERAYLDAKTSLKTFEAAKKSVEAQEEAFRTAQERYDLGVLTSYDFDQVRNQLVNAQSSFIRAKYSFIFRSTLLKFYYGLPIKL